MRFLGDGETDGEVRVMVTLRCNGVGNKEKQIRSFAREVGTQKTKT